MTTAAASFSPVPLSHPGKQIQSIKDLWWEAGNYTYLIQLSKPLESFDVIPRILVNKFAAELSREGGLKTDCMEDAFRLIHLITKKDTGESFLAVSFDSAFVTRDLDLVMNRYLAKGFLGYKIHQLAKFKSEYFSATIVRRW